MANEQFTRALQSTQEVQLTVTGRKTGREITIPVWFAQEGDRGLPAAGQRHRLRLVPEHPEGPHDPAGRRGCAGHRPGEADRGSGRVARVVDMFRAKYGSESVDSYYPKRNAAVEVPLS